MTDEIDVEETDLPDESDEGTGSEKGSRSDTYDGGLLEAVLELLTELLRVVISESFGYEISRIVKSYETARKRLRALGVLALTVLVLLLLAAIVWLLVGVVFLADRFPATGDPLVFAVGVAVGYALAVIAGLVYSR
jgi:hypothetical protein